MQLDNPKKTVLTDSLKILKIILRLLEIGGWLVVLGLSAL